MKKFINKVLTINTPINLELQKFATESLRNGLIKYDKRKGWRGSLINKNYSNIWSKNLEKYELEKSIRWEIAISQKARINFQQILKQKINLRVLLSIKIFHGQKKNLMSCSN